MLATGRTERVRDFVNMAFQAAGVSIQWQGAGLEELGLDAETGQVRVKIDSRYYRPAEVDLLIGEAEKAKQLLNWEATTSLESLCEMMLKADLARVAAGLAY